VCGADHPESRLAYYVRERLGRQTTGTWICLSCRAADEAPRNARRALHPTVAKPVAEPPAEGWTMRHPFDFTRVRLEQEWRLPYARWTRQHHETHNRLLYHLLGWGDAAREGPVVKRDGLLREAQPRTQPRAIPFTRSA